MSVSYFTDYCQELTFWWHHYNFSFYIFLLQQFLIKVAQLQKTNNGNITKYFLWYLYKNEKNGKIKKDKKKKGSAVIQTANLLITRWVP